jgi:iron complex transport system substrate-binding protein
MQPGRQSTPANLVRIEDITRREFMFSALGAALLIACGDDDGGDAPSDAESGFPRTVSHGLGETTIPAKPERIAATADRDQLEVLLAMGVKPVFYGFSGDYEVSAPWVSADSIDGIDNSAMPSPFEPDLEAIAAASPDMIIDAWADETIYESLTAIAPTVEIKVSETTSWREAQRLAGQACGTEDAAEAAISATEAEIGKHAERLAPHSDLKVALAFQSLDEFVMLNGNEIGARIVAELGMTVLSTPDGVGGRFSLEQIGELLNGTDIVLSLDYGDLEAQEANPLFRQVPAVQAGRYIAVPYEVAAACYQESTLSLRWAAGPVADALIEAAEGRGKQLS